MIPVNEIISSIMVARALIDQLVTASEAEDGFSDDEKQRIRDAATRSDAEWNARIAEARRRLDLNR